MNEVSIGPVDIPVYPAKIIISIGGITIFLELIIKIVRLLRGRNMVWHQNISA
jgi:hypothetical protein